MDRKKSALLFARASFGQLDLGASPIWWGLVSELFPHDRSSFEEHRGCFTPCVAFGDWRSVNRNLPTSDVLMVAWGHRLPVPIRLAAAYAVLFQDPFRINLKSRPSPQTPRKGDLLVQPKTPSTVSKTLDPFLFRDQTFFTSSVTIQ